MNESANATNENTASTTNTKEQPVIVIAGGRPNDRSSEENTWAETFVGLTKPQVAVIGTANGDSLMFFQMMKSMIQKAGADKVTLVKLAKKKADVEAAKQTLSQADVIFLSGGEVDEGIAWLEQHGLVEFLRELHQNGTRFIGASAGAIMLGNKWAHWEVEGRDETATLIDCLGLTPLTFDTHAEDEDWVELKCVLRLMGDGAIGHGLPSGCIISTDSQGNLKSLSKQPLIYQNQGGEITRVN